MPDVSGDMTLVGTGDFLTANLLGKQMWQITWKHLKRIWIRSAALNLRLPRSFSIKSVSSRNKMPIKVDELDDFQPYIFLGVAQLNAPPGWGQRVCFQSLSGSSLPASVYPRRPDITSVKTICWRHVSGTYWSGQSPVTLPVVGRENGGDIPGGPYPLVHI